MGFFKQLSKQKKVLIEILIILIITRVLILVVGYLSAIALGNYQSSFFYSLDLFFKWDSNFYMDIITKGYQFKPGEVSMIVFFPLYPLLVKIFSFPFGHPEIVGFIISNVALFFACFYLYKLVDLEFKNKSIAMKAVFFMLIAPVSFFFSIVYTEGLFLFLAISCFYYTRKKQWLTASILGFLLSLTRSVGFIIFIPMLMEYLDLDFYNFKIRKEKIKKDILYLLLVPAGLLSYMAYLYIKFKDPLAYFHAASRWGRKFSPFFIVFYQELAKYLKYYQILTIGSIIITLILVVCLYLSKIKLSYTIYSLLLTVLPLSTALSASVLRYLGIVFPIYISMALIANKNKFLDYLLTLSSVALLILITILFINAWIT